MLNLVVIAMVLVVPRLKGSGVKALHRYSTLKWRYVVFLFDRPRLTGLQGVKQIHQTDLNARFLFLSPPDLDILEQRLRGRGTDKEEAIQKRLKQAKVEMEYAQTPGVHDKTIVNDDLETAYKQLEEFCLADE